MGWVSGYASHPSIVPFLPQRQIALTTNPSSGHAIKKTTFFQGMLAIITHVGSIGKDPLGLIDRQVIDVLRIMSPGRIEAIILDQPLVSGRYEP
jgi:hypothetical protein